MRLTKFLSVLFSVITMNLHAQTDTSRCIEFYDSSTNRMVYFLIDTMPQFPEGNQALTNFISQNLNYPADGGCFEGPVIVSFIVEASGEITSLNIVLSPYEPANKEVQLLFEKMPNWYPGVCNGKNVPVKMILPIHFGI